MDFMADTFESKKSDEERPESLKTLALCEDGKEVSAKQKEYSDQPTCPKNFGAPKEPATRSRELFFVVRAGGHTDMFAPLFG